MVQGGAWHFATRRPPTAIQSFPRCFCGPWFSVFSPDSLLGFSTFWSYRFITIISCEPYLCHYYGNFSGRLAVFVVVSVYVAFCASNIKSFGASRASFSSGLPFVSQSLAKTKHNFVCLWQAFRRSHFFCFWNSGNTYVPCLLIGQLVISRFLASETLQRTQSNKHNKI